MRRERSRALFRAVFYGAGAIATGAGLHTVIAGARSIPGQPHANAPVESELRFYAAFYAAYGVALLRMAHRADRDAAGVRAAAGALFLAGVARASAWQAAGRAHPGQVALLAVELAAPAPVIVWQARLAA